MNFKSDLFKRNALLVVLLFSDTIFSFFQHYHASLDGDLAALVLPAPQYQLVLRDPFGFNAIFHNMVYPAPNRFFSHWFITSYFKNMPFWLQSISSPLNSMYLSCAIAKTLFQFLIALMIGKLTQHLLKLKSSCVLAMVLAVPFFQASGFNISMGIIDKSISYNFFYSFPNALLLVFIFLYYKNSLINSNSARSWVLSIVLLILSFVINLSGPLNPGIICVICLTLFIHLVTQNKNGSIGLVSNLSQKISISNLLPWLTLLIALYSLYIGKNNSENLPDSISIWERYGRLPSGLLQTFTTKLGLPLLILAVLTNWVWIVKSNFTDRNIPLNLLRLIAIGIVIYIFFLPLGGYRTYRQDIIRRDTILPITISLIFLYSCTTCYILNHEKGILKKLFTTLICFIGLFFTIADKPNFSENSCEKDNIAKLASSPLKIVQLDDGCCVLSWAKISNYDDSKLNTKLLYTFNVLTDEKYYYQGK